MDKSGQELEFDLGDGPSACYLLFWRGRVIYVGQSRNVWTRLGMHWNNSLRIARVGRGYSSQGPKTEIRFDRVRIIPCSIERLDSEEQILIQRYLPEHNVLLKRQTRVPGLAQTSFYQQLLKRNQRPKYRSIHV